jgi:hypothetical protein
VHLLILAQRERIGSASTTLCNAARLAELFYVPVRTLEKQYSLSGSERMEIRSEVTPSGCALLLSFSLSALNRLVATLQLAR